MKPLKNKATDKHGLNTDKKMSLKYEEIAKDIIASAYKFWKGRSGIQTICLLKSVIYPRKSVAKNKQAK